MQQIGLGLVVDKNVGPASSLAKVSRGRVVFVIGFIFSHRNVDAASM